MVKLVKAPDSKSGECAGSTPALGTWKIKIIFIYYAPVVKLVDTSGLNPDTHYWLGGSSPPRCTNITIMNEQDKFKKLDVFMKRLKDININLELAGNYPWIYMKSVNGVRVTRTFEGNHGFTIGFYPIRPEQEFQFTNLSEIFEEIRNLLNKK